MIAPRTDGPTLAELVEEATMLRRMRLQLLNEPKSKHRDLILSSVEIGLEVVNAAVAAKRAKQ